MFQPLASIPLIIMILFDLRQPHKMKQPMTIVTSHVKRQTPVNSNNCQLHPVSASRALDAAPVYKDRLNINQKIFGAAHLGRPN